MLLCPRTASEVQSALEICHREALPVHVLGQGTNILASDEGLQGAILKLEAPRVGAFHRRGCRITCAAALPLPRLVSQTATLSLSGLEGLVGVPGTLGGAIAHNSGTRYREIGELVEQVKVLSKEGETKVLSRDELNFGYRHSSIDGDIILEAVLKLAPGNPYRMCQELSRMLEEKQRAQPLGERSAGCVFKNPPGQAAGQLLDKAGLKGRTIGDAKISDKHANFVINRGNATARDMLALIKLAREKVKAVSGITLELEIEIWPRNGQ